jgi:hypothetical protein
MAVLIIMRAMAMMMTMMAIMMHVGAAFCGGSICCLSAAITGCCGAIWIHVKQVGSFFVSKRSERLPEFGL